MAFGVHEKVVYASNIAQTTRQLFDEMLEVIDGSDEREFNFCVSEAINSNGRPNPRFAGSEGGGSRRHVTLQTQDRRASHFNIYYKSPSSSMWSVIHYLRVVRPGIEVRSVYADKGVPCTMLTPFD